MMQRLLRRLSTFAPSMRPPLSQPQPQPQPQPPAAPTTSSSSSPNKAPWASILEWGEERRADAGSRPGASKPHIVHLRPKKNNTFVTITDADGRKKLSTSIGALRFGKGSNTPRYFSEPVTEHSAQEAVKMGIRSVVVRIKGSIFFKKKRDAVLGFRKGARSAGKDLCQILAVEDCTRLAHNGCRLRKRRRV